MKRSEMRKIVRDAITNFTGNRPDSMDIAQSVLNKIEQAGMLPPETPQIGKYGNVVSAKQSGWEPESN